MESMGTVMAIRIIIISLTGAHERIKEINNLEMIEIRNRNDWLLGSP